MSTVADVAAFYRALFNQADDRGFDYGRLERVAVDVAKRAVP